MAILLKNNYKICTSGEGYKVYISKGYKPKSKIVDGCVVHYEEEGQTFIAYTSKLEQAFETYITDRPRRFLEESDRDVTVQIVLDVIKEAREECRELWNTKFKEEDNESITRTVKRGLEEH